MSVNSFFTCIATLWNIIPTEYFPLTYDLKVQSYRHLLSLSFFKKKPLLVPSVLTLDRFEKMIALLITTIEHVLVS